ncbi:DUF4365 domain-containing protein [Streptococcus agalactiae]|uniref:DUF4365 domain-containing protein n=1 Tax=Streptococcus agalactiae TaxID=1311 RepID=UPI0004DFA4A4|nr:DUF4365 domain-containing protein [Streptococcus agalactiae]
MVNNRKIETLGLSYLRTVLDKNNYLQTYFDENDKTPLWDGEIHLLRAPSEKKSDIIGKVPVQIKATQQKKKNNRFLISLSDLELYQKNGGFVLFVVWIDEENNIKEILYKSLSPLSIKNLIKRSKRKLTTGAPKKVSIEIHSLSENKVYPMLMDFINSSRKQYSFATSRGLTMDKLPKEPKLKFYHYGKSPIDVFDYQEEHELFAYMVDDDTGIEIPIENPIKIVETAEKTDLTFTIGNYTIKNVVRCRFPNGNVELQIGSGFKLQADEKAGKFRLNYSRPDLLNQSIECTKALQELQNVGYVKLNEAKIEFDPQSLDKIKDMNLSEQLDELLQVSTFMEKMGVKKEIDLSLFDNQSQRNLYFLNKGLVLGEKVSSNYDESKLLHLRVANANFLTFYQFEKTNSGRLINIFLETPWCKKGDSIVDENAEDVSIFEVFEPNDWLKIDNCDFDAVIASYQRLVDTGNFVSSADETLIRIISASDLSEDVGRKNLLLDWAQQLSNWNTTHSKGYERALINDLQIKIRRRPLNDKEKEKLNEILTSNIEDSEVCFGVTVLLKSKSQADYYWNKLEEELQKRYQEFPIYKLYREL